jgi:hypothetical protein
MYQASDLIQVPAVQVYFVIVPDQEVLVTKRSVDGRVEERFDRQLGEAMPTHSGTPSVIQELGVIAPVAPRSTPLDDYDSIRTAAREGAPIVGRTTYRTASRSVTLDYPVTTINIANGRPAWQVDIGLLTVPDPEAMADLPGAATPISTMVLASLVYNAFDRVELCEWAVQGESTQDRITVFAGNSLLWRLDG